jgi:hypothetical protein
LNIACLPSPLGNVQRQAHLEKAAPEQFINTERSCSDQKATVQATACSALLLMQKFTSTLSRQQSSCACVPFADFYLPPNLGRKRRVKYGAACRQSALRVMQTGWQDRQKFFHPN